MRALHVYSGNLFGGIETALAALARHQHASRDVDHEAALCFDGRLRAELVAAGMPVHALPPPRVSRPHSVRSARRALADLLHREHFDAVICHAAWSQALFGGVVQRASLPQVFWAHDAATGRHWTERWARRLHPSLVIANSAYTARSLVALYPEVPATVVHVPVELPSAAVGVEERASIRRALDTAADAVVIVQASRMEAWKGHTILIDALAKLRTSTPWVCWIAGGAQRAEEMQYIESLRELVRARGIAANVKFIGERADVPRLLGAADIYCQPNARPEPFGIVFIEALAAGCPVVGSSAGAAPEIVDDGCGRLICVGDVDGLAGVLATLVDDAALRRRLGAAGPARARALCDPAAQVRALDEALTSLSVAVRASA